MLLRLQLIKSVTFKIDRRTLLIDSSAALFAASAGCFKLCVRRAVGEEKSMVEDIGADDDEVCVVPFSIDGCMGGEGVVTACSGL